MKHYGDITKLNGHDLPMVNIITGGSPCQDLSVAGKREGLAGERSGLFMEQIRIVKEMRDESVRQLRMRGSTYNRGCIQPRFMVWENVPGAFSSNKGEDFRCVLEETAKIADETATIPRLEGGQRWTTSGAIMGEGWSIAWRVHDAQFWGVPQRRKRIALVADFGGQSAPEILFERKGLSGDIKESGEEGQGVATDSERGIDKAIGVDTYNQTTTGNVSRTITSVKADCDHVPCVIENKAQGLDIYNISLTGEIGKTLQSQGGGTGVNEGCVLSFQERAGKPGGGKGILIQNERTGALSTLNNQSVVYCLQGNGIDRSDTAGCNGKGWRENQSYTLNTVDRPAVCHTFRKQGHPQNAKQGQGWEETDVNDTLNVFDNSEGRTPTLVLENHPADSRVKVCEDGIFQTLSSRMGTGGGNVPMVMEGINGDIAGTLDANYYKGCGERQGIEREVVCVGNGQLAQAKLSDKVGTLNCMHDQQAVLTYGLDRASFNQGQNAKYNFSIEEEKIGAQLAKGPGAVCNQSVVRRLTPLECERLQGFPDNWTFIGMWRDTKGKLHKHADSPRYKALGNSIALPFWEWMAERMINVLKDDGVEQPTMASLFDGIGGFPLVYSRCGCEPIWASEIEEFPIAVTKMRFPEK